MGAGRRSWRRAAVLLGVVALILVAGVAAWSFYSRPRTTALAFPDKPSIAVLPFENMSGDAGQEYFSDGMTEDLITGLSKLSGLFVIARNSVFLYKGKAVKPAQVSRDLGVRYVLEGSVRKVGNRVRITAQLIDATTGYHVWAERYDRDLQDVFALQDEVTEKIVTMLAVKLTGPEKQRLARTRAGNLGGVRPRLARARGTSGARRGRRTPRREDCSRRPSNWTRTTGEPTKPSGGVTCRRGSCNGAGTPRPCSGPWRWPSRPLREMMAGRLPHAAEPGPSLEEGA